MAACALCAATASAQQLTLELKDYATFPITGAVDKPTNNVAGLLARINFMRDEPGGGKRFFKDGTRTTKLKLVDARAIAMGVSVLRCQAAGK